MVPDAATIARRRHLMRTILRSAAVLLSVLFMIPFATGAVVAIGTVVSPSISPVGWDFAGHLIEGAYRGAGYLLSVIVLIGLERRLVAWLVPLPRARCPQCDYFLVSLTEPRCPECGLPLTHEFLDTLAEPSRPRRP